MAKNRNMENEELDVNLKEDQKTHVKFMSEIAKSTIDTPVVLKGGTALLLAYNLDRFSEDLDFDSEKAFNLEKRINDSAKKSNVKVDNILLKKDTLTTKRYVVNYISQQGRRRLKIETSLRAKELNKKDTTVINGIRVYKIENLISQKLDAGQNRSKVRDLYDLNYLSENFSHAFSEKQKEQLAEFAENPDSLVNRYSQNHSEDNILKDRSLDDLALNIHINSEIMNKEMNSDKPVLLAEKFSQNNFNSDANRERFVNEVSKQVEEIRNQSEKEDIER